MGILVLDNFEGDAGTLLTDHAPDVDVEGGGWFIEDGLPAGFTLDGSGQCVVSGSSINKALIDCGQSDFKITGKVTTPIGDHLPFLFFRAVDGDNYWALFLELAPMGSFVLRKVVAGSPTNEGVIFPTGIFGAQEIDFEIDCQGSQIVVKDLTNDFILIADDPQFEGATLCGFGDLQNSDSAWSIDYQIETPPVVEEAPCDVQIEIIEFENPATLPQPEGTLIQEFTHPDLAGIVPKGAIIAHVLIGDGSLESDGPASWGIGVHDENGDEWASAWIAEDGGTLAGSLWNSQARCVDFPTLDASCSPRSQGSGRINKYIPGGFEFQWFDGSVAGQYDPGPHKLFAILFAGQDVMTKTGIFDMDTGRGLDDIGFLPDGILAMNAARDQPDPQCLAGIHGSIGFADLQTVNNVAYVHGSDSGAGTSDFRDYLASAAAAGALSIPAGVLRYLIDYFDPGNPDNLIGMDANVSVPNTDQTAYFAFRAAGAQVRAGNVLTPSGPGPWIETDPGFKPQAVMLIPSGTRSDQSIERHEAIFGMSAFTDSEEFSHWINYEDSDATPIARSGQQPKAAFLKNVVGSAIVADGEFGGFHDDGWIIDFDTLQQGGNSLGAPPYRWLYLAIEECPQAEVVAEEEDDCIENVWTSDRAAGDDPPPLGDGDVLVAMGRYQLNPTLEAIYEFTSPDLNGKTPKGALFLSNWTDNASGQQSQLDATLSLGMASKSPGGAIRRWVQVGMMQDDPPDTAGGAYLAKVIAEMDRGGGSVFTGSADILDFIPGGVRLQTIQAFSDLENVIVIFFAGDDLEAYAWHWQTQANPTGSLVGGLGFQPDLMLTSKSFDDLVAEGDTIPGSFIGLGGVNLRNDDLELGAYQQSLSPLAGILGGAAALNPTKVGMQPQTVLGGRQTRKVLAQNAFGDGFEAVLSDSDSTGYLALRLPGASIYFDEINAPTSTGNWDVSDPGFRPQFAMLIQSMLDISGDLDSDVAVDGRASPMAVGAFTEDEAEVMALNAEIGSATPAARSHIDDDPVFLNDNGDFSAFRASFVAFQSQGWRLSFTDADGTQRKWLALAIGEPGPL